MAPTDEWDKLANGDLVWKSNKGGDTTDYVNNVDTEGNVTSTDTYDVQDNREVSETSEVSKTFKEPGSRFGIIGKGNKDGEMPAIEVIPETIAMITEYALGKVGVILR